MVIHILVDRDLLFMMPKSRYLLSLLLMQGRHLLVILAILVVMVLGLVLVIRALIHRMLLV